MGWNQLSRLSAHRHKKHWTRFPFPFQRCCQICLAIPPILQRSHTWLYNEEYYTNKWLLMIRQVHSIANAVWLKEWQLHCLCNVFLPLIDFSQYMWRLCFTRVSPFFTNEMRAWLPTLQGLVQYRRFGKSNISQKPQATPVVERIQFGDWGVQLPPPCNATLATFERSQISPTDYLVLDIVNAQPII